MKRFLHYISSRRFAIWILVVMTLLILLSNLLPKPYIIGEVGMAVLKSEKPLIYALSQRFNVAAVTKSWPFLVVTGFLFLSLAVCTLRRTKRFLERAERGFQIPQASSLSIFDSIAKKGAGIAEDDLVDILCKKRWKNLQTKDDDAKIVFCHKGRGGFWGSALFHVGMCIVLVGALVSAYTRYNGRIVLTEGFSSNLLEVVKGLTEEELKWFPVRAIKLDRFRPEFKGPFPVDYRADLLYIDIYGKLRNKSLAVNEPLYAGSYQFLLTRYGFAPRFVLKDSSGKKISDDALVLAVITPEHVDQFKLLKGLFTVKARFFPDYYEEKGSGKALTRSRVPRNPVFSLSVVKDGNEVGGGMLPIGGDLAIGKYRLEFVDLYYWAQIDISRDHGMLFIMVGFFIVIAGLSLRLFLNEKSLWVIMDDEKIGIGGRSTYFPALFEEELRSLIEDIRLHIRDTRF